MGRGNSREGGGDDRRAKALHCRAARARRRGGALAKVRPRHARARGHSGGWDNRDGERGAGDRRAAEQYDEREGPRTSAADRQREAAIREEPWCQRDREACAGVARGREGRGDG
jgi:hypothetical protein